MGGPSMGSGPLRGRVRSWPGLPRGTGLGMRGDSLRAVLAGSGPCFRPAGLAVHGRGPMAGRLGHVLSL